MDTGMALFLGAIIALVVLDLAAMRFGVDSRDGRRNW